MQDVLVNHAIFFLSAKGLKNFRILCKSFNDALDFNFWIEKFKRDNLLFVAQDLPQTTFEWLKEYQIMLDIQPEVKTILDNNDYISMTAFHKRFTHDVRLHKNQPMIKELKTILPVRARCQYDSDFYGFSMIRSFNGKSYMILCGYDLKRSDTKYDADIWAIIGTGKTVYANIDIQLFLTRLLRYHRNVELKNRDVESIRKRHWYKI
jgi:hypothetical protein